jgi:hypothetical protein
VILWQFLINFDNVSQLKRSRRSRGSDDEISSTLNNSSVDQELLKIHPSKQLKSNDEGHVSATVKPVTKELSMALNNINGNNLCMINTQN